MTHQSFVAKWAVRYECQQAELTAFGCGFVLLILALVMGARDLFVMCGITAALAGGFFGAALMAVKIERGFRD